MPEFQYSACWAVWTWRHFVWVLSRMLRPSYLFVCLFVFFCMCVHIEFHARKLGVQKTMRRTWIIIFLVWLHVLMSLQSTFRLSCRQKQKSGLSVSVCLHSSVFLCFLLLVGLCMSLCVCVHACVCACMRACVYVSLCVLPWVWQCVYVHCADGKANLVCIIYIIIVSN